MSLQIAQNGRQDKQPRDHGLRNSMVGALIGATTTIAMLGPPGVAAFAQPATKTTGSHAGQVPRVVEAQGVQFIRPDADRHNVFVIVRGPSGNLYPQGEAILEHGEFRCLITLGRAGTNKHHANPDDDGDYTVELVAANPAAASVFTHYIRRRLANDSEGIGKSYPGPDQVRTIAYTTYHRSAAVRETLKRPHPERGCAR